MRRTPEAERALRCALYFRDKLGWQPLPSKSRVKGPDLETYADFWDQPLPESVYAGWMARNVQLMTGARWRLGVVDCDGDEARAVWARMAADQGGLPETWTVETGGGGTHTYFTLPAWIDECPSRRLWGLWDTYGGKHHRGDWLRHREVRLLGDHALVIAPPSVHVETGKPYRWAVGPRELSRPAEAPGWLLRLPAIVSPRVTDDLPAFRPHNPAPRPTPNGMSFDRDTVLDAIGPRKHEVAARHGLRLVARNPNPKGWVCCHAYDRDDRTPSASIHHATGVYHDQRDDARLSFFDLLSRLDPAAFPDWQAAVNALGSEFCPGFS
jgi:hypothetical protein